MTGVHVLLLETDWWRVNSDGRRVLADKRGCLP